MRHKTRKARILAFGSLAVTILACNLPGSEVAEGQPPEPSWAATTTGEEEIQTTDTPDSTLAVIESPTSEALYLVPSDTPVPTLGLVLVGEAVHASGSDLTLDHDGSVDLDTGDLSPGQGTADFQMTSGSDPYLDDLVPMNGSYIGWYGAGTQPGKAGCNILMAASPMPIDWPANEDSYYCYLTSHGRTGWLQVHTYVSLPIFERRLIFSFATFE